MLVPLTYVNVSYQNTIPTSVFLLMDCTQCVNYRGGGRHCFLRGINSNWVYHRIINLSRAISQYWQQDFVLILSFCRVSHFTRSMLDVVVSKVKRFTFHSRSRVREPLTHHRSSTTTFWCGNARRHLWWINFRRNARLNKKFIAIEDTKQSNTE